MSDAMNYGKLYMQARKLGRGAEGWKDREHRELEKVESKVCIVRTRWWFVGVQGMETRHFLVAKSRVEGST